MAETNKPELNLYVAGQEDSTWAVDPPPGRDSFRIVVHCRRDRTLLLAAQIQAWKPPDNSSRLTLRAGHYIKDHAVGVINDREVLVGINIRAVDGGERVSNPGGCIDNCETGS